MFPVVSDSVQLGLDLATSLTIIAAAGSWYLAQRSERKNQLALGLLEATRSAAVGNLNERIATLAKDFSQLVAFTLAVEGRIDLFSDDDNLLVKAIESEEIKLDQIVVELTSIKDAFARFYESANQLRYIVFPSLHALGNEMEAVALIRENTESIMHAHNRLSREWSSLLVETKTLCDAFAAETTPPEGATEDEVFLSSFEKHITALNSIILDKEYLSWTLRFVPENDEAEFTKFVQSKNKSDMDDSIKEVGATACASLLAFLQTEPNKAYAHILMSVSAELMKARIECKEFLISLCAVSSKIQQRSSNIKIKSIYNELSGEKFFSVGKEIR